MSATLSGHRAVLRLCPSSSPASWRRPYAYDIFYSGFHAVHPRQNASSSYRNQPKSPSSSSPTASPSSHAIADVNPPASTRPADLNLPEPLPSASTADKIKRFIAIGRAYLAFYKTGLKNVYHNYRDSLPIRRSLGVPAYIPTSLPSPSHGAISSSRKLASKSKYTTFHNAMLSQNLTRSQFQLVHRAAHDVRRIIPFSILLIVCGELTPLVVLAMGDAITPFTCRVPKQIEKTRSRLASRKREAMRVHQARTVGSVTPPAPGSEEELQILATDFTSGEWIESASSEEILRACAVLGLAKTHTRWGGFVPFLYRPRLWRYAAYLGVDDELIRRGGGVQALDAIEVSIAVRERGGVDVALGKYGTEGESVERRWLDKWLARR